MSCYDNHDSRLRYISLTIVTKWLNIEVKTLETHCGTHLTFCKFWNMIYSYIKLYLKCLLNNNLT